MSLPATGQIRTRILGETPLFDGVTWSGASSVLLSFLNAETPNHVGTHITADDAARSILATLADEWEILEVKIDSWDAELPPDSED